MENNNARPFPPVRRPRRRRSNVRPVALLLALVLTICVAVGGTVAWLTDTTEPVQNVFSTSDINITLTETPGRAYKMVPGCTIEKDPKAAVQAGSEDCYLFVKVEESENFDQFMTYAIADGWTALEEGVYYREVKQADTVREFNILKDNTVTVKTDVTKEMMNGLIADDPATDADESTYPELTFTAYAIQYMKNNNEDFNPAEAWAAIEK